MKKYDRYTLLTDPYSWPLGDRIYGIRVLISEETIGFLWELEYRLLSRGEYPPSIDQLKYGEIVNIEEVEIECIADSYKDWLTKVNLYQDNADNGFVVVGTSVPDLGLYFDTHFYGTALKLEAVKNSEKPPRFY